MTDPSPTAGAAPAVFPLLEDGRLRLECPPALAPLLHRWLPLLPYDPPRDTPAPPGSVAIRIRSGDPALVRPAPGAPVLRLGTATAKVDDGAAAATLHAEGCAGVADLAGGGATLTVAPAGGDASDAVGWDLYYVVTLACALLLGRMDRALVHAAAVVAPDGGAWLLAGDTHAGKSTTCVNLITAGWRYVTDDNGVLSRGGAGALRVEGWPRRFHLDAGWDEGVPGQARGEVDPHRRWPGQWVRSAPLAGLLFPRVEAELPTALTPITAADALGELMRQSPWLLGDRVRAPEILALLRAACERPAFALRLGLDTYRDTGRLLRVLAPITGDQR
ncbi:MAG TPA: hypothetical protein VFJ82_13270 [Longimicrobium sp.]|nr:hypothetical protein [Longimicrobium sp.]